MTTTIKYDEGRFDALVNIMGLTGASVETSRGAIFDAIEAGNPTTAQRQARTYVRGSKEVQEDDSD